MITVLLLAEEKARLREIGPLLRGSECRLVRVRSLERWAEHELRYQPDVVVVAVADPRGALEHVRRRAPGFPPPVLFVQHEADPEVGPAPEDRFVDALRSPFLGEELVGRVGALARVRRLVLRQPLPVRHRRGLRWKSSAGLEPSQTAQRAWVAAALARWADGRDGFEPGHAERVAGLAADVALELGFPEANVERLVRAARLHDVGKAALPAALLRQRGPLGEEQMRLLRTHPARGASLLRALGAEAELAQAVEEHHEALDGSGYYGKPRQALGPLARVLAVAEAFDAMTSSRVRPRCAVGEALERIVDQAGRRFDREVVEALHRRARPRARSVPLGRASAPTDTPGAAPCG